MSNRQESNLQLLDWPRATAETQRNASCVGGPVALPLSYGTRWGDRWKSNPHGLGHNQTCCRYITTTEPKVRVELTTSCLRSKLPTTGDSKAETTTGTGTKLLTPCSLYPRFCYVCIHVPRHPYFPVVKWSRRRDSNPRFIHTKDVCCHLAPHRHD